MNPDECLLLKDSGWTKATKKRRAEKRGFRRAHTLLFLFLCTKAAADGLTGFLPDIPRKSPFSPRGIPFLPGGISFLPGGIPFLSGRIAFPPGGIAFLPGFMHQKKGKERKKEQTKERAKKGRAAAPRTHSALSFSLHQSGCRRADGIPPGYSPQIALFSQRNPLSSRRNLLSSRRNPLSFRQNRLSSRRNRLSSRIYAPKERKRKEKRADERESKEGPGGCAAHTLCSPLSPAWLPLEGKLARRA